MNVLKLPEQLQGTWQHALILTYGVDIPFFENALWRQFSARCRNKIILADGQQYLEACANYARSGLIRHLNQQYVAEGIYARHAAHAKLILLTNPEKGRLLVGSGNLNWQGYASGGELFTQYEYSPDEPNMLNAFLAARELIEGLVARGYVSMQAERRIQYLLEQTPWLFRSSVGDERPVRHNLSQSFLEQLVQIVGDDPVEELWILSPFYDKEAIALERLITTLDPARVILLVQASYTSVDPTSLQNVLARFGDLCHVHPFGMGSDSPYVHAKLYLLKLPKRAACLQGSSNLSQVAMLLPDPQGNIELANLLTGPRHAFDELLDVLEIQLEVVQLETLDLSYQTAGTTSERQADGWRLISGEWRNDRLHLSFQGKLPELEGASLLIADQSFLLDVRRREARRLELRLCPEAVALLGRPVVVSICWGEDDESSVSNPIFVCNSAALEAVLEVSDDVDVLDGIGGLDLDDEEFERLLGELDAALMVDRRSAWLLAGRTPPPIPDEDDEALRLDYADVDYEMLRQHPKIQQYTIKGIGGQGYARSRLQIILNAITDHFRGLLDVSSRAQLVDLVIAGLEESDAETEEEREEEETEKEKRRLTSKQRIRRVLKTFIRRYLRGIRSTDFQELVGFEVIAQNYVIFDHILWRLFAKDWVEPEFVIDSLLQTWSFFWGGGEQTGYYHELREEQQAQVLQWVRDHHTDAELLAALYYSTHLAQIERWEMLRFALRDFWREMLTHPPFEILGVTLEVAWHIVAHLVPYEPPRPTAIAEELVRLAEFETEYSFLRKLETLNNCPSGSCRFHKVKVRRASFADPTVVDCLVVRSKDALSNQDAALTLLREWMRFKNLDYYRIHSPDRTGSHRVLFYEVSESAGVFWARDRGKDPLEFRGLVTRQPSDWDTGLSRLQTLAKHLDAELVLPHPEVHPASPDLNAQ